MKILIVALYGFSLITMFHWVWNMSGMSQPEIDDIWSEFRGCPAYMRPWVLSASVFWRRLLRVGVLVGLNVGPFLTAVREQQLRTALLVIGAQVFLIILLGTFNKRRYRQDLGYCRVMLRSYPNQELVTA